MSSLSEYIRAGAFFTMIILLIVHFVFLYKKNTSYISWILGFVLFTLFPFTWIDDLLKYSKTMGPVNTKIYWGTLFSLLVAVVLEITSLIIVIMTNSFLRTKNGEDDSRHDDDLKRKPNRADNIIRKNTEDVKIMYVTTVAIMIGMVINLFVGFNETSTPSPSSPSSPSSPPSITGKYIKDTVEFLPKKVNEFEEWWTDLIGKIYAPELIKAFFLFCAGFLIPFFTLFVKVSHGTLHYDVFFPAFFQTDIKSPIYFIFLALMLSCAVTFGAMWFVYTAKIFINSFIVSSEKASSNTFGEYAVQISAIVSLIICNAVFNTAFNAKDHVMEFVYVLVSFCFALLGTPIAFSILDLIARIGGQSLAYFERSDGATVKTEKNAVIRNAILLSIFISFWLGISIGGKKWIGDLNNKKLRMIIVTIICMTIGVFLGLSGKFKVFTLFFSAISIFIRTILKYVGPFAIIILTAIQIYLAEKSFHQKNRITDDYSK